MVELAAGKSRLFSGESVRLKCSVPSDVDSTWDYVWFKGNVKLQQTEQYEIWSATLQHSDKYSCQGVRETYRGAIHTIQSLPMEIYVEGGWVLLHGPSKAPLVGGTLPLTYRVRGNPHLEEVILYKDGREVMTQTGPGPRLQLVNVTLNDQGSYWCRATWDNQGLLSSAMSTAIGVSILEVLTKPSLLIEKSNPRIPVNMMRLICLLQFNAPAPDVLINYYFYKDNAIIGPSTSNNNMAVSREPGWYKCKAKVPMLGLVEWSEPTSF